jgi:hypothetical protein
MQLQIESLSLEGPLRLTYKITNMLGRPTYVQNLLGAPRRAPTAAYVHYVDGVAVLYCGTPMPPPMVSLGWPGRPPAQKLEASGVLAGKIELPLPLEEWTIGLRDDAQDFEDTSAGRLCLIIEYQVEGIRGLKRKLYPDGTGTFDVWGVPPSRLQAWAELPKPLVIRRRKAEFARVQPGPG